MNLTFYILKKVQTLSASLKLGFTQRQRGGSHIIFQYGKDFVNLQNFHGKIKGYQVRQVREILKRR